MRKFSFLSLLLFICLFGHSQLQVGVFGGVSNYLGDLTDKIYQNSGGAFGLTAGYQLSNRVNLRAGITFGKVKGADSLSHQTDLRLRNLSFQSAISEFSLIAELNTFDMEYRRWSPYVFGGIAIYHFNPYTFDQLNNKVYLQPLSTEGEGLPGYSLKRYALTQPALPFGGGIKYNISSTVRIAVEIGLRKLFTDYLDDVSGYYADPNDLLTNKGPQSVDLSYRGDEVAGGSPGYPQKGIGRGSPRNKDFYYFTGLHLTFQLPGNGGSQASYSGRAGKDRRYGCPTVF